MIFFFKSFSSSSSDVCVCMVVRVSVCGGLLTRQVAGGDGVGLQMVRVLQPQQSLGRPRLVVLGGEVLALHGQVGDEGWSPGRREGTL